MTGPDDYPNSNTNCSPDVQQDEDDCADSWDGYDSVDDGDDE